MTDGSNRTLRIAPLAIADLPDDLRADAETYVARRGYVPNSFLTMARRPDVVRAYVRLREAIDASMTLPGYLRVMMFHVASLTAGCRYCQAHSIRNIFKAHANEVSPEKLDALWDYEESPLYDERERVALRFAQASAMVPNAVTDDHIRALREHYSDDQVVEMVGFLAWGAFLNRINDTLANQLEQIPLETADRLLGGRGWAPGKHGPNA